MESGPSPDRTAAQAPRVPRGIGAGAIPEPPAPSPRALSQSSSVRPTSGGAARLWHAHVFFTHESDCSAGSRPLYTSR